MWGRRGSRAPPYLKVVVCGPFAVGKTTFVKSVCSRTLTTDVELTSPREQAMKSTTTVALDFGRTWVKGIPVYVFGTPGQSRFLFMWRVLAVGMHGYLFIVDGSNYASILEGRELYEVMKKLGEYPHLLAVNKQDIQGAIPPEVVADIYGVDRGKVVPLIAKDRRNAMEVLEKVVDEILNSTSLQ